ncbi:SH3 domain-containing protein 19 isoform X2 [Betta splendens]|uniref:SH3 domain-containing protein 19 isoform X2 n=1 Tax=Betta splendens TaxID=158456 RepID=A0A6P7MHE5_BETSP|nr:SH3 domain-containing protein 19 isoform X2 [Betta splendens]
MAEPRRVDEDERERAEPPNGSPATDHPDGAKAERLHSCQGPLSSIRAAIKRTRTNSQGDHCRDRRRPEITIVSAEPLANNSWFPETSGVSASRSHWPAGIHAVSQRPPSYNQVILEKTHEEKGVRPTAAPRRFTCTATSATQTDPTRAVPQCTAAPQLPKKPPAVKKPQKPPRPSPPKPLDKETAGNNSVQSSASTKDQNDSKPDVKRLSRPEAFIRSVTVHWDRPTENLSAASSSDAEPSQRPVPLPRIKSRKQAVKEEEEEDPILVKLSDNSPHIHSGSQNVSTNEYLKELLEVFSARDECEGRCDTVNQPGGEDAVGDMSDNQSQRNIWARIQAFESQTSPEDGNAAEAAKPQLPARKPSIRPPIAAKPPVAFRPQADSLVDGFSQKASNADALQMSTSDPRPHRTPGLSFPPKPWGAPIKDELEELLQSKAAGTEKPSTPALSKANSFFEAGASAVPPTPPVKPFKEPLKPNLNINNHNSASLFEENTYINSLSDSFPVKPQWSADNVGGSTSRQSIPRRPTTIRVPSKVGSLADNFVDNPPPLPSQSAVSSLSQRPVPSLPFQDPFQSNPAPSLPPRRTKTLPPRPSPAKSGPGRPPPPSLQVTGRSLSTPWETSPKPERQVPPRRGLLVPPRPRPGHYLYNKYTLELPHGIAGFDYTARVPGELSFEKNEVLLLLDEIDQNTFECQAGDVKGSVHKSCIKVVTPLGADVASSQGFSHEASSSDDYGQRVQVLYNFIPEGSGELELREGDVVTMVEQVNEEWYKGTCRGSTGFFPINYVKPLSDSPKSPPRRKPKPPSTTISGPRCVARFDFEGEHSDELSFSEGDVIQLKEYVGDDWARGKLGVLTGIFPLNFVEVIEDLPPAPSQQPTLPPRREPPGMVASPSARPAGASQSSGNWVVALYDYAGKSPEDLSFQQGDYILLIQQVDSDWSYGRLNGRAGVFPRLYVEDAPDQRSSNNQQSKPAGGVRARALYDFNSNCQEELSLQVGDVITNLESIDGEWFLGELRGRRALVPKNYVQVLN